MFTGIITDIGRIARIEDRGDRRIWIETHFPLEDLEIGASVACSGACLTVVAKKGSAFAVDVSAETISKTATVNWAEGSALNLERALKIGDELGGHIVTGHVDGVGRIAEKKPVGDSHEVWIEAPRELGPFLAPKGSVTVEGVSLTVNKVEDGEDSVRFSYNLIPHTADMTTLGKKGEGEEVNVEVDTLARYIGRMQSLREAR